MKKLILFAAVIGLLAGCKSGNTNYNVKSAMEASDSFTVYQVHKNGDVSVWCENGKVWVRSLSTGKSGYISCVKDSWENE
jgi:uncharacterized lipoprotein